MELSTWLIYSAVAGLAIISPGPAILLAVSNGLTLGLRRTIYSSAGNITGLFVIACIAMVGLGAVLKTSASVFLFVKIAGAAYLIYIGITQWRAKTTMFSPNNVNTQSISYSKFQLLNRGFLVALSNPKSILFFTALFPQFINSSGSFLPQFLTLTCTFMVMSFISLMAYAYLARSAQTWFSNDNRVNWFNRTTGGGFILIGLGLLRLKSV